MSDNERSEVKMTTSGNFDHGQATDYEASRVRAFAGSVRPLILYGCMAVELNCPSSRVERTRQDVRFNSMEHYHAVIQLSGRSTMVQDGRITELALGDIALVDSAKAAAYFSHNGPCRRVSLHLPRQTLLSHLGLAPACGSRKGTEVLAGRVLFRLILDAVNEYESSSAAAESYMQLAIYDLLGALFAIPDRPALSSHTNELFNRICSIIKNRFADPDFGPCEVAAEAGISLRYLQKLFTARGSSCTHFLQSARLDHAARQLCRRRLLGLRRPISELAYASGFNDYTHFARQFRRRFGHSPGTYAPGGGPWHSRAAESTPPSPHDFYIPGSSGRFEETQAIREDAA
jgi:AraC-like DNA-binding protein